MFTDQEQANYDDVCYLRKPGIKITVPFIPPGWNRISHTQKEVTHEAMYEGMYRRKLKTLMIDLPNPLILKPAYL